MSCVRTVLGIVMLGLVGIAVGFTFVSISLPDTISIQVKIASHAMIVGSLWLAFFVGVIFYVHTRCTGLDETENIEVGIDV